MTLEISHSARDVGDCDGREKRVSGEYDEGPVGEVDQPDTGPVRFYGVSGPVVHTPGQVVHGPEHPPAHVQARKTPLRWNRIRHEGILVRINLKQQNDRADRDTLAGKNNPRKWLASGKI